MKLYVHFQYLTICKIWLRYTSHQANDRITSWGIRSLMETKTQIPHSRWSDNWSIDCDGSANSHWWFIDLKSNLTFNILKQEKHWRFPNVHFANNIWVCTRTIDIVTLEAIYLHLLKKNHDVFMLYHNFIAEAIKNFQDFNRNTLLALLRLRLYQ